MKQLSYKSLPAMALALMGFMLAGCQQTPPSTPTVVVQPNNPPSTSTSTSERSTSTSTETKTETPAADRSSSQSTTTTTTEEKKKQ